MSDSQKAKKQDQKRQLLICPQRDLRISASIDIGVVESLYEATTVISSGALVLAISNVRLLDCIVEYADLFDVDLAVLTGVPGCDYDVPFEQATWSLDKVGYDALVLEATSIDRMEQLKQAERPRAAGGKPVPVTTEEVAQMRIPSAVDLEGWND